MGIDYDPDDAVTAWPEGDYDAVLKDVKESTSKRKPDGSGGNPMEVWTFQVYDDAGREQTITEYVVVPAATFKIKQLAAALGRKAEFERRTFQADTHIGETVRVVLGVEAEDGFDDKNRIRKFKAREAPAPRQSAAPASPARQPAAPAAARAPAGVAAAVRERAAATRPTEPPFTPTEGTFAEDDIPF
jgi:hypothetical protein